MAELRSDGTASVVVKPRPGAFLTRETVNAIRQMVSAAIPDMRPQYVSVTDISQSKTYGGEEEDSVSDKLLRLTREHERTTAIDLSQALSFIPDVNVLVTVELSEIQRQSRREQIVDPKQTVALQSSTQTRQQQFQKQRARQEPGVVPNASPLSVEEEQGPESSSSLTEENSETLTVPRYEIIDQELFGAMPEATRVSVTIPESYPRSLLLQQNPQIVEADDPNGFQQALLTVKTEVETKVKQIVATRINVDLTQNPNPTSISVQTVVPQEPEMPTLAIPMTDKLFDWGTEWGGAVMMVILALWALRSLNRSMPKLPDVEVEAATLQAALKPEVEEEDVKHQPSFIMPESGEREALLSVVKENPEMTAAVISNWIRNAR
ncbi:MAG: hypothetical protein R3C11_15370 [Planctomycetaceae bacterium]